ncbi:Deoxyuridine 5'-triphosphate nucleotidohydrolase [Sesamum angolense]|uniref:dUTP diphosphatase n=1 Tax=Sesamum angolense TaxID=2727404 RepID=A0AAE1W6G9_9LAMI|nr:Deoxyuridine 5'-triphosphate nucleotidohydrolase [Sesamum angolense]
MAQAAENPNHAPEIEEPSPKIQKIHQNGVLKIKPTKPLRFYGSKSSLRKLFCLHSFCYDLSSAAETKVPARGKALIPTDLSIAVPEGTYARIGNFLPFFVIDSLVLNDGFLSADSLFLVVLILGFCSSTIRFGVEALDLSRVIDADTGDSWSDSVQPLGRGF